MKLKLSIFCLFILLCSALIGITHEVKQDYSGDFTTIQACIDVATHSDTVLVYPGTYYENINFLEKSITITSLYSIIQQDSLITQTIIDGNHQGRCVTISNCESAKIVGFTIQNGLASDPGWTGAMGGGILIEYGVNTTISDCKIINNFADEGGGGVGAFYTENILFIGNNITNNRGKIYGGGINAFGNELNIYFDTTLLNSIYVNYAPDGSEINIPIIQNPVEIVLDTFTVTNPDYFFIAAPDSLYTFATQHSVIEEIDQDLYVSPSGSDENSGLTPDDPLQTIAWAQTLIKRNDENPHTIFLAEGTYSPSLNNQIFPLNIKQGVTYQGISPELTILNAEDNSSFFHKLSKNQEFVELILKDLSFINGNSLDQLYSGCIFIYQADLNLENVLIEGCVGDVAGAILTFNGYVILNRALVRENYGSRTLSFVVEHNCPNPIIDVTLINTKIINNHPATFDPDFRYGTAIEVSGHSNIDSDYKAKIINCEITGNHHIGIDSSGLGGTSALKLINRVNTIVSNCTIGDNTLNNNTGCSISLNNDSTLYLYNTILYDNEGYSMNLLEGSEVNINNSLIEGGSENINYYDSQAIVNWYGGNLDENPQWLGENNEYPFALSAISPCIDAGTLDLPEGIELPEYDLAGNPRIYGDGIDMGAYEFQGDPQSTEPEEIVLPKTNRITNYPNPFNPTTTIKLNLSESGKIDFSIYNVRGQKVKTLIEAYSSEGIFEFVWDGDDNNEKQVSSGTYFMKLTVDGVEKAVEKCTLLK